MIAKQQAGLNQTGQHLLPDAIVAFVDGELPALGSTRARAHIAQCPFCAGEAAAQLQARGAVRSAPVPAASGNLLAALRAIPDEVDFPSGPDNLAVTEDGQLVTVLRSDQGNKSANADIRLGTSTPLGSGHTVLGRRTRQGAGVLASGLVFGALVLVAMHSDATPDDTDQRISTQAQQAVVTSVSTTPETTTPSVRSVSVPLAR